MSRTRTRLGSASLLSLVALVGAMRSAAADPDPTGADPPSIDTQLIAPPVIARTPAGAPDAERLRIALSRFDFGDYAGVVAELAALVEAGARSLPRADRLEALRAYGIACALLDRPTAAEGAFLLLLEADPGARLDPRLVRPEAVALFDAVRARNSETLLAAYRKGRGRRYAVLNLLPPAGQLQNRQYKKAYTLLGVEVALLALNITSGSLLYAWRGDHQDFPGHEDTARTLRPVNWVSFGALLAVVVYGIIDGFVVGRRRSIEEHEVEDRFRTGGRVSRNRTPALILEDVAGLGVRF